jgi:carbon monoxide dehydrogenase subunit G
MAFPQAGDIHVGMTGKFERWEDRDGHRTARISFDGKLANVDTQKRAAGSIEIGAGSTIAGIIYFDIERHVVSFGAYTTELKLTAMGEVVPMTQRVTSKMLSILKAK